MTSPSDREPSAAVLAAVVLAALVQRVVLGFMPCDDALISWRFADHMAAGDGLVFNPGDPVFGCTTLSYALVLTALHALGLPMAWASWGVTLAADMAVGALLVAVARAGGDTARTGLIAFALWLLHPVAGLNALSAMETSIFTAGLLAFALALTRGAFGWALVAIAALVWTRIDGVVAFPVWVAAWVRAGRPWPGGAAIGATAALAAAYLGFTLAQYGTPIPQSAVAKAAHDAGSWSGVAVLAVAWPLALAGPLGFHATSLSTHALLLPGLAWRIPTLRRDDVDLWLLATAGAHAAFYVLAGRTSVFVYIWYFVPALTLVLVPAVRGTVSLLAAPRAPVRLAWAAAAGAVVGAIAWAVLSGASSPDHPVAAAIPFLAGKAGRVARFVGVLGANAAVLGLLAAILGAWVAGRARGVSMVAVWAAMLAGAALPLAWTRADLTVRYAFREAAYLDLGAWIDRNLPPDEIVGAWEIGALGWAAPRHRIHDELGLVTAGAHAVPRPTWMSDVRPALVVDFAKRRRGTERTDHPADYVSRETTHHRVLVRPDLVDRYDRAGPALP